MISHHIDHQVHASIMQSSTEILQVLRSPEMLVQRVEISLIVSMIARRCVLGDWRYPDGVEAHGLDIVEIEFYAFPATAAVLTLRYIAGSSCRFIRAGEAVGHDLIDRALAPLVGCCSKNTRNVEQEPAPEKNVEHVEGVDALWRL